MRKILLAAVLLLLLVPALGGCQERETEKAFVAPYDMSQDQQELLSLLGLEDGGTSMKSLTPQSYFTPQELADMDVAQAVTLEFSAG